MIGFYFTMTYDLSIGISYSFLTNSGLSTSGTDRTVIAIIKINYELI